MDLIAGFIEQCIVIDYDCKDKFMASDLFSLYSRWAKANNEYEMSSKKFFTEVSKKLPDKGRNGKGIFYTSIRKSEYALSLIPTVRNYTFSDLEILVR